MSSLVRHSIIRLAEANEDVFVVGETVRQGLAADGAMVTATGLIDGGRRRAEDLVAEGEREAAGIIARAAAEADAAFQAGHAAGFAAAQAEVGEYLAAIRSAAAEGINIRDGVAEEAMPAIARAVAMATRRIVGAAYEGDPSLVAEACADAVRAAAGQQILSIRVAPDALETVRAALVDVANYVRRDAAIELGGCLIDLEGGTIDATLDARLDLMELALRAAGGGLE